MIHWQAEKAFTFEHVKAAKLFQAGSSYPIMDAGQRLGVAECTNVNGDAVTLRMPAFSGSAKTTVVGLSLEDLIRENRPKHD